MTILKILLLALAFIAQFIAQLMFTDAVRSDPSRMAGSIAFALHLATALLSGGAFLLAILTSETSLKTKAMLIIAAAALAVAAGIMALALHGPQMRVAALLSLMSFAYMGTVTLALSR